MHLHPRCHTDLLGGKGSASVERQMWVEAQELDSAHPMGVVHLQASHVLSVSLSPVRHTQIWHNLRQLTHNWSYQAHAEVVSLDRACLRCYPMEVTAAVHCDDVFLHAASEAGVVE